MKHKKLSPVEAIIYEKYGDKGLHVYAVCDGKKTGNEIIKETGVTQILMAEILDFMDQQGIIKLEYHPGSSGPS